MKRLTTENSLKPLVAQFVPIKIDVASDEYKIWRREHRPEKGAIPQMYIVRADGKELYNKVGGLPTKALQSILGKALQSAGATLNQKETELVEATLHQAERQLQQKDAIAAAETLSGVPNVFDASIECYAKPVLRLREVATQVEQAGKQESEFLASWMKRLAQSTSKNDATELAEQRIQFAKRYEKSRKGFAKVKPLAPAWRQLDRAIRQNASIHQVVQDVRQIQKLLASRNARYQALSDYFEKYQNTSLSRSLKNAMSVASETTRKPAGWKAIKGQSTREWTSKGGGYRIRATIVALSSELVRLKDESGETIEVQISQLSTADQSWLKDFNKK